MIAKEAKNIENLYDYSTNYNKLHVKITSSNTNNKIYSQFMDDVLCYTSLANNVCKCNCYGTCGELVEGQFLDGRDFLISLPINVTNEIEVILIPNSNKISIFPQKNTYKIKKIANDILKYFNITDNGFYIKRNSNLPLKKGMASSSADLTGTACGMSNLLGYKLI